MSVKDDVQKQGRDVKERERAEGHRRKKPKYLLELKRQLSASAKYAAWLPARQEQHYLGTGICLKPITSTLY